jgi:prepilin-type N-terminal cleavage/methylation domain-containing protein
MRRSGFTLVELLIALLIATITLAAAGGTFAVLHDSLEPFEERVERAEANANGLVWIQEAIMAATSGRFAGGPDTLTFRSTLWTSKGWTEPGEVSIALHGGRLRIILPGARVILPDSIVGARFDYLGTHGGESPWLQSWTATRPPSAVRLRRRWPGGHVDTLVFLVVGGG